MPHDDEPELRESPLTPADDERVRRLLAEARHTEPMPAEVAGRLDEVLAGLSADRAGSADRAPVVELAARRRRTAANLLVAAAAVIAVGVGISQVLPGTVGGDAMDGAAPASTEQEEGAAADDGGTGGGEMAPSDPEPAETPQVRVRSERFGADVRRIQLRVATGRLASLEDGLSYYAPGQGCVGEVGRGEVVPAAYDGAQAVVVLRVPSGDVQVVDLYLCGDTEPRRSITLTLP